MPRVQQQGIEKETGRRKVHHVEAPRPAEDAKLTSLSLQELLPVVLKKIHSLDRIRVPEVVSAKWRVLVPLPSVLSCSPVRCEAGRGSHPNLSTLNGALGGLERAGSAGRWERLERRHRAGPSVP